MTTTTDIQPEQYAKPITKAPILEGSASAPKFMGAVAVRWELDAQTGYVISNDEHAGRVIESIPGKLYYFESTQDAARGAFWDAFFPTAHRAAEQGAVRAELYR